MLPFSWTPVQTYLIIFYKKCQPDGQWGKGLAAKPRAVEMVEMVKHVSPKLENFRAIRHSSRKPNTVSITPAEKVDTGRRDSLVIQSS